MCLCGEESNDPRDDPFIQFFWALCVSSVSSVSSVVDVIDVINVIRVICVIWIRRTQVLKEERADFGRSKSGEMENEGGIGLIRIDGNGEEN